MTLHTCSMARRKIHKA